MLRIAVYCALLLALACGDASAAAVAAAKPDTKSPTGVAKALYSAWKAKARKPALTVATPEAVTKLFGVRWRTMRFEGCNAREEGGFECIYRERATDLSLAMNVDGGASLGGYNVVSLSFSSEE